MLRCKRPLWIYCCRNSSGQRSTWISVGGVSANSGLREGMTELGRKQHWEVFIPPFSFTTDNAAMIAEAGYFKFLDGDFCAIDEVPFAKTRIN